MPAEMRCSMVRIGSSRQQVSPSLQTASAKRLRVFAPVAGGTEILF